jgi:hypothetical protein
MNSNQCQLDHSRLRTPSENRTALIEPAFECVPELVAENQRLGGQLDYDMQGRSLAEISSLGRSELLEAARRWTAAYRDVASMRTDAGGLIYLAGHQPQMFHPGVWFKNFALGELARRHGATAVNLIVDGDVISEASLRVPGGSLEEPQIAPIAFDRSGVGIPYEERKIEDRELFASFGRRASEQIRPLVADPLLAQYWPLVETRARDSDNLGTCLVQARHQLEGSWGLETLEVPLSRLCVGEAFAWFAAHLLAHATRFREVYNRSLAEYRQRHRLRSVSHPAPDLAEQRGWIETPFWTWTAENPRRRRLFAKATGAETLLSDGQSWETRLPLHAESDAGRAAERLIELQHRGVRIRPRALVTTLWARLALGDLFVHGIGGAKYDCVTDRLIERFFRLAVPRFVVVSATLHLPIGRDRTTPDDVRLIENELRDMAYHPERHLAGDACQSGADTPVCRTRGRASGRQECLPHCDRQSGGGTSDLGGLLAEKRRWIATPQTTANARERCRDIRRVNAALRPWLDDRREQLATQLAETSRRLQAESVLAWREYAFCLHPESTLREFLSGLLHKIV